MNSFLDIDTEFDDEVQRSRRRGAAAARPPAPRPGRPGGRPARPALAAPRVAPIRRLQPVACSCPVHDPEYLRWLQSRNTATAPVEFAADATAADEAAAAPPAEGTEGELQDESWLPSWLPSWGSAAPAPAAAPVDRSSRDYIMWVQRSLNSLLRLSLAVDGISGPMTRSAVRQFQSQRRLAVDGVVGPQTEAALIAAGAGRPPAPGAPAAGPAPAPMPGGSGRVFPTSADGTPLFRQGDPEWGERTLGRENSIGEEGCAITSMAMAISKIARRIVTPGDVDQWIDTHGGYGGSGGDSIRDWNVIAQIAGLGAQRLDGLNLGAINAQLDSGRPVVVGVDKNNNGSTDHWIALTRRGTEGGSPVYYANDPAPGTSIKLRLQGTQLVGISNSYRSTGSYTLITGG
jgi:peptidoglycan hydrolase-like protein with peptidoglycan-binding domain